MNLRFKIELKGLDKDHRKISENSNKVLWKAMNKMQELAIMRAPVDTGLLKGSIRLYPMTPGAKEYMLVDGVDYGIHLEYGTSPHHPPISALKGWSRRVLGDENAAFAVARSIALHGTPAQPFFRPSLLEVKNIWLPIYFNNIT